MGFASRKTKEKYRHSVSVFNVTRKDGIRPALFPN